MRPESKWDPRLSTFVIAPAFWVASGYLIGEQVVLFWVLIFISYGAVLLAGAAADNFRLNRWVVKARAALGILGVLFWGGLLAMVYAVAYLLISHGELFAS